MGRKGVRGVVRVFTVTEWVKERRRPIFHPKFINDTLGKDTLQSMKLKTRAEIRDSVLGGAWTITLDFSSYFDQFKLHPDITSRLVFEHFKELYSLLVLPMGLRQAVECAQGCTWVLVSGLERKWKVIIDTLTDNVRFVGSREDIISAAYDFILRCRRVRAVLNEVNVETCTRDDLYALTTQEGDFLGENFCYRSGRVRSTQKILEKVAASWSNREKWTA
jgi:hypothetical protein